MAISTAQRAAAKREAAKKKATPMRKAAYNRIPIILASVTGGNSL